MTSDPAHSGERIAAEVPPTILARPDHPVSRQSMSSATVKVLYRLKNSGFRAYLVGGGVRDLMLGIQPKDFDVSTDAQPQEIRRLFRNARIIGRRFRLAHILFHDEIVEVATFRRAPEPEERDGQKDLLIKSDNTFGTPREDAFRRDFTINALFYDVGDFSVIDYVGGVEDLEKKLVRVIGDPDVRFCEDPVRMLRACEFAGRLGFSIESRTQEGIQRHRGDLLRAAPPRLTEELLQLLQCGHAAAAMQWMLDLGLLEVLMPEVLAMIEARGRGAGDFSRVLPTIDRMQQDGRDLSGLVLLGSVLLPELLLRRFELETKSRAVMSVRDFRDEADELLTRFSERFAVTNFIRSQLLLAFEGFHRLCSQRFTPAQRARFASKSYFDDALMLLEILVMSTGDGRPALEHWQAAQRQRQRRPEPKLQMKRPRQRRSRRGRR